MPTSDSTFRENLLRAIAAVSSSGDCDVLVYNSEIDHDGFCEMVSVCKMRRFTNVLLVLSTFGGSADSAYRIGRLLREKYKKVVIFVPRYCKSAGTLLSLAADEIVIGDHGELGPLDAQISKPDELGEFGSGLATNQAFDFLRGKVLETFRYYLLDIRMGARVTTKMSAEIATNLTIGLFAPIYQQIDPVRMGEMARSVTIADEYGQRLKTRNVKDKALDRLVAAYPSHGFVIDLAEARELFHNVRAPNETEDELVDMLDAKLQRPDSTFIVNLTATLDDIEDDEGKEGWNDQAGSQQDSGGEVGSTERPSSDDGASFAGTPEFSDRRKVIPITS